MTQKQFDIENEKDMQDLWEILPDWVTTIKKTEKDCVFLISENGIKYGPQYIKINWHDATEITRPVNYEDMIGCVGWFWNGKKRPSKPTLSVLWKVDGDIFWTVKGAWFEYFTPAKKSELKFWGE